MNHRERLLAALLLSCAGAAHAAPASLCTGIASAQQRLDCFDREAGTPSTTHRAGVQAPRPRVPETVAAIAAIEKERPSGDTRFRMREHDERAGQRRVLISAPALNRPASAPLLTLSCIDNITRLQFIVQPPVQTSRVSVALRLDGRAVAPAQIWQVLEDGQLIDAGRGLAAIELVRRLGSAAHLDVTSNLPALDGLRFDADGLDALIATQRAACRW